MYVILLDENELFCTMLEEKGTAKRFPVMMDAVDAMSKLQPSLRTHHTRVLKETIIDGVENYEEVWQVGNDKYKEAHSGKS